MKLKSILALSLPALIFTPVIASAQMPRGAAFGDAGPFAANPTIEADQTALDNAFRQLRTDVRAGNTSAVATDQSAITAAFAKLQADRAALAAALATNSAVQAAQAAVRADRQAIAGDQVQLRADEIVGDRATISADEQLLANDEAKLRTDMRALRDAIAAVSL